MKHIFITLLLLFAPVAALADATYIVKFLSGVESLFQKLIPIVSGLALLMFIWGLVKFITQSGDERAVAEGKQFMIWGIVALFCAVSVWGIVTVAQNIFGIGGGTAQVSPGTTYTP